MSTTSLGRHAVLLRLAQDFRLNGTTDRRGGVRPSSKHEEQSLTSIHRVVDPFTVSRSTQSNFTETFNIEPPKLDDVIHKYLASLQNSIRNDASDYYAARPRDIHGLITRLSVKLFAYPHPRVLSLNSQTTFRELFPNDSHAGLKDLAQAKVNSGSRTNQQLWKDLFDFVQAEFLQEAESKVA